MTIKTINYKCHSNNNKFSKKILVILRDYGFMEGEGKPDHLEKKILISLFNHSLL